MPANSASRRLAVLLRGTVSGGGAVVVPTALPSTGTIVAKWSSDTIPVIADGATPPSWTDEINGAVATVTGSPVYKTNRLNGKPSMLFTGSTQRFDAGRPAALAAAIDSQIYSVMIVYRQVATNTGYLFSAYNGSSTCLYQDTGAIMGRYGGNNVNMFPSTTGTGFSTLGSTSGKTVHGGGTGVERIFANATCFTGNSAPGAVTAGANFTIGNINAGTGGTKAEILDIIVWSTELTPTQVIQFHKWACDKYAQPYPWTAPNKFVALPGDSIMANVGLANSDLRNLATACKIASNLGLPLGSWSNLAINGTSPAQLRTYAPTEVHNIAAVTGVPTHVGVFEWANDRSALPGAATTNRIPYLQELLAAGITKVCWGTSTDDASSQPLRDAYNAYWDTPANRTGLMAAYVPIHLDANIGVDGQSANTTYFTDTTHLTALGQSILAGLFSAQMAGM